MTEAWITTIEVGPAQWQWRIDGRCRLGELDTLAAEAVGRPVAWLADSRHVSLLSASLPSRNRDAAMKALPYLLEEQVAADIETLSFIAVGPPVEAVQTVAVMDTAWYQGRLDAFAAAGINLALVVPDLLALPASEDGPVVLPAPERVLVRDGLRGFAAGPAVAGLLLNRLLAEREQPAIGLTLMRPADMQDSLLATLALPDLPCREQPLPAPVGEALLAVANPGDLNLLQGRDEARRRQARRPWLGAACAAGLLAVVVATAGLYRSNAALEAALADLDGQVQSRFRDGFPEVGRVVDPALQGRQQLAGLRESLRTGPDFLAILARAGAAMQAGNDDPLALERIGFAAGTLDLHVSTSEMRVLEAYRARLADGSVSAEIVSAENRDARLHGRLRVREAAP